MAVPVHRLLEWVAEQSEGAKAQSRGIGGGLPSGAQDMAEGSGRPPLGRPGGGAGGGGAETKPVSSTPTSPSSSPSKTAKTKKKSSSKKKKKVVSGTGGRRKHAALYELLGAVSLYAFCVFAPGLLGAFVRFYEDTLGDVSGLHIVSTYRPFFPSSLPSRLQWEEKAAAAEPPAAAPVNYGGGRGGGEGALTDESGADDNAAGGAEDGAEVLKGAPAAARPVRRRLHSYLDWTSSYLCGSSMLLSETGMCHSKTDSAVVDSSAASDGAEGGEGGRDGGKPSSSHRRRPRARDRIRLMLYGGGFRSDVELIFFLSLWLATVRVFLIHLLVPKSLAEPKRLAAMVRCKSSHLLSGQSYQFSPIRPVRSVRGSLVRRHERKKRRESDSSGGSGGGFVIGDDLQQQPLMPMAPNLMAPNLMDDEEDSAAEDAKQVERVAAIMAPASPMLTPPVDDKPSPSYVRGALDSTRSSFCRALGHEIGGPEPLLPDDDGAGDGGFGGGFDGSMTPPHLKGGGTGDPSSSSAAAARNSVQRMFSGPRYATAVFRFLYCSTSCLMAYGMFRSADFWPVHVGGSYSASTSNCWDLSGGVALGWIDSTTGFELDRDFDHRNAALRLFFLAQGSYQLHSLCFHVMSMALLFLYGEQKGGKGQGGTDKNKKKKKGGLSRRGSFSSLVGLGVDEQGGGRLVSMKSSMRSYVRPLLEHVVSLCLVFGAYIFSGLRRLGAVGIFTLEVSSAFIQLLQMCVNAPDGSRLRNPKFLRFFHRFVVVPIFVYCRFVVLPFVVWHSAAFESQAWLDQIERAFVPGSAAVLYAFFNGQVAFIFGLNLIHFRRLLFHPHLKQLFAAEQEQRRRKRGEVY